MADHITTPYFPQDLENYAPWVAKHGLLYPYGDCQCGCGQKTRIATSNATRHGYAKGQPLRYTGHHFKPPVQHESVLAAFFARCAPGTPSDCWNWQGHIIDSGYGLLQHNDARYRAHRVSWEIHRGPIPAGMYVCHTCDNRKCCNPNHLWLGTHADNQVDKVAKDRTPKGEEAGPAKLKESTVREMRQMFNDGVTRKQIATLFNTHYYTVADIISRRTWKHIP